MRAPLRVSAVLLLALGDAGPVAAQPIPDPVSRQVYLMGTRISLTAYAVDRASALDRLAALVASLEASEAELSTWRSDTPFNALNHQPVGLPLNLSPSLCRLVEALDHWQRETGGAFDPTVGALVAAYGLRGEGRLPTAAELAAAQRRTGWRYVDFAPRHCRFLKRRAVILEEGSFGKGAALDRLLLVDGPWLVDMGGQIMVHGAPPGATGWRVAVARPDDRTQAAFEIRLGSGTISTSGGSERDRVVGGRRVPHILDPRSGRPAKFGGSVSVWHERGLAADILSTALFVMGPEEGLRWADARDIAACYLQVDPGRPGLSAQATTSWRRLFPGAVGC